MLALCDFKGIMLAQGASIVNRLTTEERARILHLSAKE